MKKYIKYLEDVYDNEGETVMHATILTMVKKIDQSKIKIIYGQLE